MHHKVLKYNLNILKSALFPNQCLSCGSLYYRPTSFSEQNTDNGPQKLLSSFDYLKAKFVCSTCTPEFSVIESPLCTMCGKMFTSREGGDHICEKCIKTPKYFTSARAAASYDNLLMNAILQLKYKGKTKLAKPLGRILLSAFLQFFSKNEIHMITPVPLYKKKFRQRGFNQAFLMIRDWANQLPENGYSQPVQVCRHILQKGRHTKSQTGLDKKQRLSNVKNSFTLKNQSVIYNKNILIVDDVYTTGSTVNECARILLQGGANRIDVLTLARAI